MLGDTIDGRYRVLRVIGEGGMGAVYEAQHLGTGRRVAVKVIRAKMVENAEIVQRFQREARAAGSIETPHIAQVFDTGTDPASGVIYMVMELLQGEDLQHLLKRHRKLPPELALRLIGQACVGLGKAHAAGVVHRDIKPANLFLSRQEGGAVVVKVVDFGIAKTLEAGGQEEASLTRTGGVVGSPLYVSPEQAMGRKTIDQRTDVWSLGVVLYLALSGKLPHVKNDTVVALMLRICTEPAPPIQDLAPWVRPEVALVLHRMLAIDPDARFPSVAAVLEAMRPWLPNGLAIHADDLVPLPLAEETKAAARAPLDDSDAATVRMSTAPPSSASPEASTTGGEGALSVSQGAPSVLAPSRRSPLRPLLALPLVLGVGGLAAYALVDRRPTTAVTGGPAEPSAAAPVVDEGSPPVPPAELVVRLAVEPADARVTVDGHETPTVDGGVDLRGALGSVHRVRIVRGSQEVGGDVAITSVGAVPPRLQIEATTPRSPLKPAGRAEDAPRKAPPAPAPAKTAGKPGVPALDRNFE